MAYYQATHHHCHRGTKSAKNRPREDCRGPRKIPSDFKMAAQMLDKHLVQHTVKSPQFSNYNTIDRHYPREGRNLAAKPKETKYSIYVHHVNHSDDSQHSFESQNERHHTLYDHEVAYCRARKRGSDSISHSGSSSSGRSDVGHRSRPHVKGDSAPPILRNHRSKKDPTRRLKQNVLSDKVTIDKLEETYWAKWKPNRNANEANQNLISLLKRDLLDNAKDADKQTAEDARERTTVEDISSDDQSPEPPRVRAVPVVAEVEGREVSLDREPVRKPREEVEEVFQPPPAPPMAPLMTPPMGAVRKTPPVARRAEDSDESRPVSVQSGRKKDKVELSEKSSVRMLLAPEKNSSQSSSKISKLSVENNSGADSDVKILKHLDSLVILSRKQTAEKVHYQQPKCIKLYKNEEVPPIQPNYIKGGSYPLKSCLKQKDKPAKGNVRLGRPGSPLIVQRNPSGNKDKKK